MKESYIRLFNKSTPRSLNFLGVKLIREETFLIISSNCFKSFNLIYKSQYKKYTLANNM